MRRLVMIIILQSFLFGSLFGCDCEQFSFETQEKISTSIFVGKFIEYKDSSYQFERIKQWKGRIVIDDTISVFQSNRSCYLPRNFHKDEIYLIYANKAGIHSCGRSMEFKFTKDLDKLAELHSQNMTYDEQLFNKIKLQNQRLRLLIDRCGIDDKKNLTDNESLFLSIYFRNNLQTSELANKKIIFITGPTGNTIETKKMYFSKIKEYYKTGNSINTSITYLSPEEKLKSGGYDAVITSWVKFLSKKRLKKIINDVRKNKTSQ